MRFVLAVLVAITATFLMCDQESFIVKKTKQIVLPYQDQWCDLYGQLLQSFADLDMQKSAIQKKGVSEIMCLAQSNDGVFDRLSKKEQQDAVLALKKIVEQMQQAVKACSAYNKELDTMFVRDKKTKK